MRNFEIQCLIRFDWENVSNEAILEQILYLALHPEYEEALNQTKREARRRMAGGKGWFVGSANQAPIVLESTDDSAGLVERKLAMMMENLDEQF